MNGLCPPSGYIHKPVTLEELTEQLAKTRVELEQYKADAHYYFQKCGEQESALCRLRTQNDYFRVGIQACIVDYSCDDIQVAHNLENLLAKATPHG